MSKITIAILVAIVALVAAEPTFKLGKPTFLGTGCPEGSVQVITSTDGQTVSVLFSEYVAETYGNVKRDRKSCNLAMPVDVKQGISVGIFKVDYRGNAYVPNRSGSEGEFRAEYFFGGFRGPTVRTKFQKNTDEDFTLTDRVVGTAVTWSPCGASTTFRINTSLTAKKRSAHHDDVSLTLDSTDATVEHPRRFEYFLMTKSC